MSLNQAKKTFTENIFDLSIPVPALDIVIFTIYNGSFCVVTQKIENNFALPGGIISSGLTLEDNFDNILKTKMGIKGVYKEQLFTFGDPKRDPRGHVLSIAYYALIGAELFLNQVDLTKVNIIKLEEINKYNFLYDHLDIILYAEKRLKRKLEYTNIAKNILGKSFRISELQKIYEIILGKEIDKRNFQKKIFKLGLLKETGKVDKTTNRPSKLYTFVDKKLKIYEII